MIVTATRSPSRPLAAGRKKDAQVTADPHGYRTTPTQAAESTAEFMIEDAERPSRRPTGAAIIRQAQRGHPGRPTNPDPDEAPIRFREDGDDGA